MTLGIQERKIPIRDEELDIKVLEKRYIVIDKHSGKVLDDCKGYGYRSKTKAMTCWNYKNKENQFQEVKKQFV